jgi:hypothetical protein
MDPKAGLDDVHKRLISCPYRKPKQDLSVYQDAD